MTAACIAIVLLGPFAIGLPLQWALGGCRPLSRNQWIAAPFLGLAGLIIVLQNLVYANVPIGASVPWFWSAIGAVWIVASFVRTFRSSFQTIPYGIFLVAAAVYLLQGIGLVKIGAATYCGRAWNDQYNYTALAQFLIDERFDTGYAEMGQRPYLFEAIKLKSDRIGQSVVQGFFAASLGVPAKALFEPTIILSTALIALGIYVWCDMLGIVGPKALVCSATAGLLPAVTLVHLESFLSHALAMPLLLFYIPVLVECATKPSIAKWLVTLFVLTGAASIYTEFLPVFWAITALLLFAAVIIRCLKIRYAALVLAAIAVAPVAFIPAQVSAVKQILGRLGNDALATLYPWALSPDGISCIWFGDLWTAKYGAFAVPYAFAATGLALCGLLRAWLQLWRVRREPVIRGSTEFRQGFLLLLAITGLAVLVLGVIARDRSHAYQFYKLLLSCSPLLALALALLSFSPRRRIREASGAYGRKRRWSWKGAVQACMLMLAAFATLKMVKQSTDGNLSYLRCMGFVWQSPEFRELQARLEKARGENLLVCAQNPMRACWISYLARRNQMWQTGCYRNDLVNLMANPESVRKLMIGQGPLPDDVVVVFCNDMGIRVSSQDINRTIMSNDTYQIWQPGRFWALPAGVTRIGAPPTAPPVNAPTDDLLQVEVVANHPGKIQLSTYIGNSSLFQYWRETLRIRTDGGFLAESRATSLGEGIRIPINAGKTTITVEILWPLYETRIPEHPAYRWPLRDLALKMHFIPQPDDRSKQLAARTD
jgi:hypothetical protein